MKFRATLILMIILAANLSAQQLPQAPHKSLAYALTAGTVNGAATAQTVDIGEPYWTVSIHGQYSDISGAQTNNGTKSGAELRIAQHWTIGANYFSTMNPSNTKIALVGPRYRFGFAHLFKSAPQFFDPTQFEFFVGPDVGLSLQGSAKKFAWDLNAGIDRHIGNNIVLRLIDVSYVRASVLPTGGQVIGNHTQVASGLGLSF